LVLRANASTTVTSSRCAAQVFVVIYFLSRK
jgi:hypothetical protein